MLPQLALSPAPPLSAPPLSAPPLPAALLGLARRLNERAVAESDLPSLLAALPAWPPAGLAAAAAEITRLSLAQPRLAWSLAAVTAAAARANAWPAPALGQALWCLGWAANCYVRPAPAQAALDEAQALFRADVAGDPAWLAACDWQRGYWPWARPRLAEVAAELTAAQAVLAAAGPAWRNLAAGCRLSLAFTQTFLGDYDSSGAHLDACQDFFAAAGDQLNLGRCWAVRGAWHSHQGALAAAGAALQTARQLLAALPAPAEVAQVDWRRAFMVYTHEGDAAAAQALFTAAAAIFTELDLPIWEALCQDGLSQIAMMQGELDAAYAAVTRAQAALQEAPAPGPSVNILFSSGWLDYHRGDFTASLANYQAAEALCRTIGNRWMHATIQMTMADVYIELGRYQQALGLLESALAEFQALGSPARLAECNLRLGETWWYLNRPAAALEFLDEMERQCQAAEYQSLLPYLAYFRALAWRDRGETAAVLPALEDALAQAEALDSRLIAGWVRLFLADVHLAQGDLAAAATVLRAATDFFAGAGHQSLLLRCQLIWGRLYLAQGAPEKARAAWTRAQAESDGLLPTITWPAEAGLAELAWQAGDGAAALAHYQAMAAALQDLRRSLAQTSLAAAFWDRPAQTLDLAVDRAAAWGDAERLLRFSEAGKAQSLARYFTLPPRPAAGGPPELARLRAEIRWRQGRLQTEYQTSGWLKPPAERALRRELAERIQTYEARLAQHERQAASVSAVPDHERPFTPTALGAVAAAAGYERWLALAYHLTATTAHVVALDERGAAHWSAPLTGRRRLALAALRGATPADEGWAADLAVIADWLLPPAIRRRLAPDDLVMIAPHGELHHLPWAALPAGPVGEPLCLCCRPLLTPSLQNLVLLAARAAEPAAYLARPLLVAASEFAGRYEPLPAAQLEAGALSAYAAANGLTLAGAAATAGRLDELSRADGLSQFSCWHIAAHSLSAAGSGRLDGLALADRDVWLDELWHWAPLPPLVTLATCRASRGRVHAGDEHVGLVTTCLAAGAGRVIATQWPLPDSGAARFMPLVYARLAGGDRPAAALAGAQRQAWRQGLDAWDWAGFNCHGLP